MTENELDHFLNAAGRARLNTPRFTARNFFTFSIQIFTVHYSFSFTLLLDSAAFANYLDNPIDCKEILNEKVALRSECDERACNRCGRACRRTGEFRRHLDA
jgi:hypothetical protein